MKTMRSLLAALALLTLLATPALAQDEVLANVTLKLTLKGDVPVGQTFEGVVRQQGSDAIIIGVFCGRGTTGPRQQEVECVGNGTTYTLGRFPFQPDTTVEFSFTKSGADDSKETFFSGSRTIDKDTTISAFFNFDGSDDNQQGGDDQKQIPTQLPSTGAGGMAGSGIPVSTLAALVSLLVAGGYVLSKRR